MRRAVAVLMVAAVGMAGCNQVSSPAPPADVYVASGVSGGDGSVARPFGNVQDALDLAGAGTVVHVAAGRYQGPVETRRGGAEKRPLRIVGAGARDVTLSGGRQDHTLTISHDHVHLTGFTISGGDQLLVIEKASGARVEGNTFADGGGECLRLKRANDNVVSGNIVGGCGRFGFDLARNAKNGEGIYIGTALDQIGSAGRDRSRGNRIVDNRIVAPAECIDIKEGATDNVVSGNDCTGGEDPVGGGISVRGNDNTINDNVVHDVVGAGVRLGGDGRDDGTANAVVRNRINDVGGVGVKIERGPQRQLCGNIISRAAGGASNTRQVDPTEGC